MVFTYTAGSTEPLNQVRLLINDVDSSNKVFENEEITSFLVMVNNAVFLAAALALDTIADNEVLASKVIKTQDLATDGAKAADSIRARARTLRELHEQQVEEAGFVDVIEPVRSTPIPGWL